MLAATAASGELCERLRDRFIALPGIGAPAGPGASAPSEGRLWVQSCEATAVGSHLRVAAGGLGWLWVDAEESGFRVRQHVYFHAAVNMVGQLEAGYDPRTNVASVWLRPVAVDDVSVRAIGAINARPETAFAAFVDVVTLGVVPSAKAREAVGEKGSTAFRESLRKGGTLTCVFRAS